VSFADVFVPVDSGVKLFFRIIEMKGRDPVDCDKRGSRNEMDIYQIWLISAAQ